MTREAKIGMLTGLGVIVVVGVLLSKYLGDGSMPGAMAAGGGGPTDRMQQLPIGRDFRQQQLSPVNVPGMGQPTGEVVTPGLIPAMAAGRLDDGQRQWGGPSLSDPVSPIPVPSGPMVAMIDMEPPVIRAVEPEVRQGTQLANSGTGTMGLTRDIEQLRSMFEVVETDYHPIILVETKVTHEVAAGDTLSKIAKKYLGSSSAADLQKIVAANPGVLKDTSTVLMTGKKLMIPVAKPTPAARPTVPITGTRTAVTTPPMGQVPLPGELNRKQTPAPVTPLLPGTLVDPAPLRIYEVKAGDTLEKIARKLAPSKPSEMVEKLKALNGIKDANTLRIGATLKIPG